MKRYQDSETGLFWEFEDDFDPLVSDNRNIPKTLTQIVKEKPTETSVWHNSTWIEKDKAPQGYVAPISSIPSYNPAWMAHLSPYSAIIKDENSLLKLTLDHINNNSYNGSELAKVVGTLPVRGLNGFDALISYDGAIAIPQCEAVSTRAKAIEKLNEILCCLLIGGIHAETLTSSELAIGSIYNKDQLFSNSASSIHSNLRNNWASPNERFLPLIHPRVLKLNDLQKAFEQGQKCLRNIPQISPFFIINGYTSLANQNNIDALNNLWIAIEQLTSYLWDKIYLKNSYSNHVKQLHTKYQSKIKNNEIRAKHEILQAANIISSSSLSILNIARRARNDLAHQGITPIRKIIVELWTILPELVEKASSQFNLGIRNIKLSKFDMDWEKPLRTNFDEWNELQNKI